jgi:hypothetical protein
MPFKRALGRVFAAGVLIALALAAIRWAGGPVATRLRQRVGRSVVGDGVACHAEESWRAEESTRGLPYEKVPYFGGELWEGWRA